MATSYEKKRKKNMIMMGAALVVLAVGLVAFIAITKSEEEEQTTDAPTYELIDFKASDIVGVSYSYVLGDEEKENVNVAFEFREDKWFYAEDEKLPVSQGTISKNVIDSIIDFRAGRKIENPKDISQYGIDKDIFNMVIDLKDGSKVEFTAGIYNDTMGGFYLQKSGDSAIYLLGGEIDATLYDLFRPDVYEYATMDVMPNVTADTLQFVGIHNGKANVELTYKPDGVDYDLINSSYWFFQAPFSRLMGTVDDKIEKCIEIITAVNYYKLADYEATDEELEAYGITGTDKYYSMSYYVESEGEDGKTKKELYTYKMEIGKLDKSGKYYYVRPILSNDTLSDVSRKVSCVQKTVIEDLLGIDALDYVYRMASYIPLDNVVNGYMDITTPDGSYKVDVAEDKRTLEDGAEQEYKIYTVNGTQLSEKESTPVTSFYSKYMTAFFKQIIYDEEMIKEINPVYTVEYKLKDQPFETQKVEYTVYDNNFYQVTVDGYTDVLVSRIEIDTAFAELKALN